MNIPFWICKLYFTFSKDMHGFFVMHNCNSTYVSSRMNEWMNTYIAKFRHFLSYHRYKKRNNKVTVKAKQLMPLYVVSNVLATIREYCVYNIWWMQCMFYDFGFSVSWHMLFVYAFKYGELLRANLCWLVFCSFTRHDVLLFLTIPTTSN